MLPMYIVTTRCMWYEHCWYVREHSEVYCLLSRERIRMHSFYDDLVQHPV